MILYIIKTLILSSLFYGLYYVLLHQQKSFRWNRLYLIIASLLAVVMPLIRVPIFTKESNTFQPAYAYTLMTFNVYKNSLAAQEINYAKIITAILFIGLLWGLLRIVLGFIVLKRSKENATIETYKEVNVFFNHSIEMPFSFNGQIFIPGSLKENSILPTILEHELAHIKLKHSYDKLYFSFLQAMCWFNPFVYLFHKEIELLHEYEADAYVTKDIETDFYVETLLQTLTYNQTAPTILVHSFFTHPLKTRITMLYKKSTNAVIQKIITASVTIIVCVTFISFQTLAQEKSNQQHTPHKAQAVGGPDLKITVERPASEGGPFVANKLRPNFDAIYEKADVMPEFVGGDEALLNYLSQQIKFPEGSPVTYMKVMVQFIVAKDGHVATPTVRNMPMSSDPFEMAAIKAVQQMPNWKPGYDKGKAVDVQMTLPIVFKK